MRLIDADRLSEAIYDNVSAPYEEAVWAKEDCLTEIDVAPTVDAVHVVRCRECKYYEDTSVIGFVHCWLHDLTMRYNDFCSYGKREGGSDND